MRRRLPLATKRPTGKPTAAKARVPFGGMAMPVPPWADTSGERSTMTRSVTRDRRSAAAHDRPAIPAPQIRTLMPCLSPLLITIGECLRCDLP